MAEVITAVGAGGKTTCLTERGRAALRMGKSVCFTTSTKIWAPGGWEKQEALPGGIRRIAVEFPEGTIDYMGPAHGTLVRASIALCAAFD